MNDMIFDTFPFKISKGFHTGMTMACFFVHPIIYNEEELNPSSDGYSPDAKPKYCIVAAFPFENRKLKTREASHVRFSCTEEEYNFFCSNVSELRGKEVYLGVEVNSWANSSDKHGVWYRYVSGSMRRFDGKPIGSSLDTLPS